MKGKLLLTGLISVCLVSCSDDGGNKTEAATVEKKVEVVEAEPVDPMTNKGVGPITSVTLDELNDDLVAEGLTVFEAKCTACHKVGKRYIGPDMAGITARRSPEWIMNMILNPDVMVKEDPIAKQLLMEYSSPMANQSLTEEEARQILEYFRTI